jgi:hypothetical protein
VRAIETPIHDHPVVHAVSLPRCRLHDVLAVPGIEQESPQRWRAARAELAGRMKRTAAAKLVTVACASKRMRLAAVDSAVFTDKGQERERRNTGG